MDKKLFNRLMKSMNEIKEKTYPDFNDFKIRFKIKGKESRYLVPNKTENGVVKTHSVLNKEDLLKNGVSEDKIIKMEYNYDLMQKNKKTKLKLFAIKGKQKKEFNLKSNIKYKDYSDGFTIVNDLRKTKKILTMSTLLKYKGEYLGDSYFNTKELIKLRIKILNNKPNSFYKLIYKGNKVLNKLFINKKDLSKTRRIDLCNYNNKK